MTLPVTPPPAAPETAAPAASPDQDPFSMGNWMRNLPPLGQEPPAPPPPKKEEPPPAAPAAPAAAAATAAAPAAPAAAPATPAPAAPATTPPPATPPTADEDRWPRNAQDWETFRTNRKAEREKLSAEIKTRDTQLAELQTRLKEFETKLTQQPTGPSPEIQAEIDRLKQQNEDYSKRLMIAEVTSHPQFQAHFTGRTNEAVDYAKAIVGAEKAEAVAKVLLSPQSDYRRIQIEEIVSELSPLQQVEFGSVLTELRKIDQDRQKAIANAQQERDTLAAQNKTRAEKQVAEHKALWGEVIKAAQDPAKGNPLFQARTGEGAEAWNAAVKERLSSAEKILFGTQGMAPKDIMQQALNAAAYPVLLSAYQADMAAKDGEIAKLQEQVKGLLAAQPRGGATSPNGGGEAPTEAPRMGMTPQEASAAFLKGIHSQPLG